MKIKEMRAMPVSEAERQVSELKAELAKERAVAAGGTRPENPGKARGIRKNIARLLTVINEKKRSGEGTVGKKGGEKAAKQAEKNAPVAHAAKKAAVAGKAGVAKKKAGKGKAKKGVNKR
jgi:large subunit ribosomal protein L29